MVKYVLCLGLGVGIGYFVATKKLESDYARLFEIRLEDAHAFYEDRLERRADKTRKVYDGDAPEEKQEEEPVTPPEEVKPEPQVEAPVILTPVEKQEAKEKTRVDYRSMYRKEEAEKPAPVEVVEPEEVTPEVEAVEEGEGESTPTIPRQTRFQVRDEDLHILTDTDYLLNVSNFVQVTLNYFYGDDILADQEDRIIRGEERERIIGKKIYDLIRDGYGPQNKDQVIYFKNDEVENEFDLFWNVGKYTDEVGLVDVTE